MRPHPFTRRGYALALLAVAAAAPNVTAQYGAFANPTGRPIGGGEGYGAWVPALPYNSPNVVSTKAQLLAALGAARLGTVVYVRDDARIDLTGEWEIEIPAGVTLASGRGRRGSLGGLLFTTSIARRSLLIVRGDLVRISGLRIQGPDTEILPSDCGGQDPQGIRIDPRVGTGDYRTFHRFVVVDNNEMWGWPSSAVYVQQTNGVRVAHNHMHHNRRQVRNTPERVWRNLVCVEYGFGYGICIHRGSVLIEANLFDHNRHDIACTGAPGSAYEACYNLVLNGAVQHSFDVHGYPRVDGQDGPIGGTVFYIHHNTFLQSDKPAVRLRGVPEVGMAVVRNEFRHSTAGAAANQRSGAQGNFWVLDNRTGVDRFPAWFASFSGETYWRFRRFEPRAVGDVAFGDFDGDGCSDAFTAANGRWYIARGAREDWIQWNVSSVDPASLRFGDFDGDGRMDVFRTNGSEWLVSYGGSGSWQHLAYSGVSLSSLAFADLDGDGRTDVFYGNGSSWYASHGGTGGWVRLGASAYRVQDLRLADFDGDGRADVFRTDGSTWYLSSAGTSSWRVLNRSTVPLSDLAFADFDGDRRADVFYADGSRWRVSDGGAGAWRELNRSDLRTAQLAVVDVNGDGRADVLSRQSPH